MTLSEEKYIKTIFHLSKEDSAVINTNAIAQKLKTKASSVTEMIKKLATKKLLNYIPYQGVELTEKGRKIGVGIVRKHRLWEYFLVEKLNFLWDEVHELAEQLEHIKSKKLITRLDNFLGNPTIDPHGDPIPDKDGNMQYIHNLSLSEIPPNQTCVCMGVRDSSPKFLKYLDKQGIGLGQQIEIISKETFDDSMNIRVDKKNITISHQVAKNLYVKKL